MNLSANFCKKNILQVPPPVLSIEYYLNLHKMEGLFVFYFHNYTVCLLWGWLTVQFFINVQDYLKWRSLNNLIWLKHFNTHIFRPWQHMNKLLYESLSTCKSFYMLQLNVFIKEWGLTFSLLYVFCKLDVVQPVHSIASCLMKSHNCKITPLI